MFSHRHPVPSLQGTFEEWAFEAASQHRLQTLDAPAQQQKASSAGLHAELATTPCEQKSRQSQRPLTKLVAQIILGMHLLQQRVTKSDEQVAHILQTHVDKVDNFIKETANDLALAIKDIEERIRCLEISFPTRRYWEPCWRMDNSECDYYRAMLRLRISLREPQWQRARCYNTSTRLLGQYLNSIAAA